MLWMWKFPRPSRLHGSTLVKPLLGLFRCPSFGTKFFQLLQYMNLASLFRNSAKFTTDLSHRLCKKGLGLRAITIWCMTTSGLRLQMFNTTLMILSTKACTNSSFSCWIFTKAKDVRWCGRLVANCALSVATKVSK